MGKAKLRIKIFIAIISIILFSGTTEIILRLINLKVDVPQYMKFNPHFLVDTQLSHGSLLKDQILFWKLNPSRKNINSLGCRDKEFTVKKDKGIFRIISIGDSVTFGPGVDSEDTYPKRLEKILNTKFPLRKFEVINAGVLGYSSYQGLNYLKRDIIKYQPDLITVHFGLNDGVFSVYFEDEEQKMPVGWIITSQNFLIKSKLYQLLCAIIFGFKYELFRENSPLFGRGKNRVSPQNYHRNLEQIKNFVSKHNVKIVFITPMLYKSSRIYCVKGYCLPELGIKIDLISRFNKEQNPGELFVDGCHFTKKGHQIAAEEIANALIKDNLIVEK